jgi:hypothetical protein
MKQLIALWAGVILVSLMVLFPPRVSEGKSTESIYPIPRGYSFIFSNDYFGDINERAKRGELYDTSRVYLDNPGIDYGRLILQTIPVILIAGALIITFRDKKIKT